MLDLARQRIFAALFQEQVGRGGVALLLGVSIFVPGGRAGTRRTAHFAVRHLSPVRHSFALPGLLFSLILLATACVAQQPACEIPFHFAKAHMIVVKGSIGDLNDQSILIDTGAYFTAIDRHVRERLRLHRDGSVPIADSSNVAKRDSMTIPQLQLGPAVLHAIPAVEVDLDQFSKSVGVEVDAVIGLQVLARGTLIIDFAASTLKVSGAQFECSDAQVAQRGSSPSVESAR